MDGKLEVLAKQNFLSTSGTEPCNIKHCLSQIKNAFHILVNFQVSIRISKLSQSPTSRSNFDLNQYQIGSGTEEGPSSKVKWSDLIDSHEAAFFLWVWPCPHG